MALDDLRRSDHDRVYRKRKAAGSEVGIQIADMSLSYEGTFACPDLEAISGTSAAIIHGPEKE